MWIAALSNSMKLWTIPCRANQERRVMVESSDKTCSTGKGNGNLLQYSCSGNPMNSMKRPIIIIKKKKTLKDELPKPVGAQHTTKQKWRNISGKNEEAELKQKQHPVWMWLVMQVKSNAVKNDIAQDHRKLSPWIKVNWKWSNRRWQELTSIF